MRWKEAMARALYGPDGFFRRERPADHFRTSAHASPVFAEALAVLVTRLDDALDHPARFDLIDLGAGRGELLTGLLAALPVDLSARIVATGVELAPRPDGLDPAIGWTDRLPERITGLLVATEWLDNVPVDIVELDEAGIPRYLRVDDGGHLALGGPVDEPDAAWLAHWWPLDHSVPAGARAEIGGPRDAAWAGAVSHVERGLALAVDYGHVAGERPLLGSLTAYRAGREVEPVADGSCDLTVAVALDAVAAAAGSATAAGPPASPVQVLRQAEVLRALGADGRRPPIALASKDPAGYVRALARAGAAAELTDPAGLGGHCWILRWV